MIRRESSLQDGSPCVECIQCNEWKNKENEPHAKKETTPAKNPPLLLSTICPSRQREGGYKPFTRYGIAVLASKGRKNRDTFSMYACHPCAGTMLIFSVSFQF